MTSNFLQVGRIIKCGHCCPTEFDIPKIEYNFKCECICHDSPVKELPFQEGKDFVQDKEPAGGWEKEWDDKYSIRGKYDGAHLDDDDIKSSISSLLSQTRKDTKKLALCAIMEMKEEGRVGTGWVMDGQRMIERFDELISEIESQ